MEYSSYTNIIITILVEVFASHLSQRTHSCDILNQVTALAITYCDILHTLFSSQQSFDYCNSVRDTWRNQCTCQRTERFAVDAYTCFFIHTHQTVCILPILDSLFDRVILRIRNIIRDTTTFIRSKTTSDCNFSQQTSIRSTVTNLYRIFQCRCHHTTNLSTIVNSRETVQHRTTRSLALFDTYLTFVVTVQTSVTVDCCRQQVSTTFVFQVLQQFNLFLVQSNTSTRLNQCNTFLFSFRQLFTETSFLFDRQLIIYRFLEIDILTSRPLLKHFRTFFHERVIRNSLVF